MPTKRLIVHSFRIKEPVSALSHLLGIFLALGALAVLISASVAESKPWHAASFAIYGLCMLLVYTASTLYHWLPLRPSQEKLFKRIDHSMIYLMIAGSYTPIGLIALSGPLSWSVLALIWVLAAIGIFRLWRRGKRIRIHKQRWKTTVLYLVMGWVCAAYAYPIAMALPTGAIVWLAAGGLAYTIGAVVYSLRIPNPIPDIVGFHEVFHLFVILGSVCHLWMMWRYMLPLPVA